MNNQLQEKKVNHVSQMTTFLSSNAVKNKVNAIVGAKEGDKLISNLVSNIQQNPTLAECTQGSIVNGALAGHALKLDFALQQAYLIPFNDKNNNVKNAQFCIGWKGYIQLALRSGQYKKINVIEIKESELKKYNRLTEEYEIEWIENDTVRENKKTTHYLAYIELINGFEKSLLWSKEKIEEHAKKYSSAYQNDLKYNTSKSFWIKDFDAQAKKTMIRQLISKFGVMSTEMQQAYKQDMAVLDENGNPTYVDNADIENSLNVEVEEINDDPIISGEQIDILCSTIVANGYEVSSYLKDKGFTHITKVKTSDFAKLLEELNG